MNKKLLSLFEQDRFVEALYYASIEAMQYDTADNQLAVGLACCAAIRPVANALRRQDGEDVPPGGFTISRKTVLVGHGYLHLERAMLLDSKISVPSLLSAFCHTVRRDLIVYGSQEFKFNNDFEGNFTLVEATWGSIALLDKMGVPAADIAYRNFYLYRWGAEFVGKRLDTRV